MLSNLPPVLLCLLERTGEQPEKAAEAARLTEGIELSAFGMAVTIATWALLLCLNGWCLHKLVGRHKPLR